MKNLRIGILGGGSWGTTVAALVTRNTQVTLWARNPQYIKDIVYTMRFDKASARYAEFGSFYVGYVLPIAEALRHLRIGS